MREEGRRTVILIWVLILIILALVGVMVYFFAINPAINNYINTKQVTAYNLGQVDLLNNMLAQIQQLGYVSIPIGNQTLYLAPVVPQQQSSSEIAQ